MTRKGLFLLALLLLVALVTPVLGLGAQTPAAAGWRQKVDPALLSELGESAQVELLVYLESQADLAPVAAVSGQQAKGALVYTLLTEIAQRTQPVVVAELERAGVPYRRYWIRNFIWVRGDAGLVGRLARRQDVAHLYANPYQRLRLPLATACGAGGPCQPDANADGVEWNIDLVGAPVAWQAGYEGQGAVIGGQDTGYDWSHPAVQAQYRGWDGVNATHDYNWHDAIHEEFASTPPGNPCGYDTTVPCDDQGHGTHTLGTMVGDDSASVGAANAHQIGMAPAAQWIGCRNMEQGWGSPTTYAECYEWFVAPYPPGADPFTDGRPDLAPHVVSNSWSCPAAEGCTDPDVLAAVVESVRAAGIVTVHAAGNAGPGCGSVNTPSAIYEASFTVGATDSRDAIASFSSRGPVTVDGSFRLKPNITAPGVGVRSALPGQSYGFKSGTSMATPHVAGLVALLLSAEPDLAGDVDELEGIIMRSAQPLGSSQGCGGDAAGAVPNNVYGWGRIDSVAALSEVTDLAPLSRTFFPLWLGA